MQDYIHNQDLSLLYFKDEMSACGNDLQEATYNRIKIKIANAAPNIHEHFETHGGSLKTLKVKGIGPGTKRTLESVLRQCQID